MMFLDSAIAWTVSSIFHSVWVPVISIGFPEPVLLVPKPPKMTLGRLRFIALNKRVD